MKLHHKTWIWLGAFLLMPSPARIEAADPAAEWRPEWGKARDTATEQQLQVQAAASRLLQDQIAVMKRPMETAPPSPGNSLYSKSIMLFDGEMYTLIPVGSVLHLPVNLRGRVIGQPSGDFTFWPNFVKRNATWLTGHEVPLKMAQGDSKLAEGVLRGLTGHPKLVVAVYRSCPISVLEPAQDSKPTGKN